MKNRIQEEAQTGKAEAATLAQGFMRGWPEGGARELSAEPSGRADGRAFEIETPTDTPEHEPLCNHALIGTVKLSRWQGIRATVEGTLCELGNVAVGESDMQELHRPITDAEARTFLLSRFPLLARLFGTPEGVKA